MFEMCEICGDPGRETALAEVLPVCLCLKHVREWIVYCEADSTVEAASISKAKAAVAKAALQGGHGSREEVVQLYSDLRKMKREMRKVASDWLESQMKTEGDDK